MTDITKAAGGAASRTAPPIAAADLQEGDTATITVTILGRVLSDSSGDFVAVALHGTTRKFLDIWVHVDSIATHTPKPRPLVQGDRAWSPQLSSFGVIKAIDGDLVWFALEGLAIRKTLFLSDLERAQ